MDEGLFVDYQMEKFGRICYKPEPVKTNKGYPDVVEFYSPDTDDAK